MMAWPEQLWKRVADYPIVSRRKNIYGNSLAALSHVCLSLALASLSLLYLGFWSELIREPELS